MGQDKRPPAITFATHHPACPDYFGELVEGSSNIYGNNSKNSRTIKTYSRRI